MGLRKHGDFSQFHLMYFAIIIILSKWALKLGLYTNDTTFKTLHVLLQQLTFSFELSGVKFKFNFEGNLE